MAAGAGAGLLAQIEAHHIPASGTLLEIPTPLTATTVPISGGDDHAFAVGVLAGGGEESLLDCRVTLPPATAESGVYACTVHCLASHCSQLDYLPAGAASSTLRCTRGGRDVWSATLPGAATALVASERMTVVGCFDGTLFCLGGNGQLLLPRLALGYAVCHVALQPASPASLPLLSASSSLIGCITADGMARCWSVVQRKRLAAASIVPLLHGVNSSGALCFAPHPTCRLLLTTLSWPLDCVCLCIMNREMLPAPRCTAFRSLTAAAWC